MGQIFSTSADQQAQVCHSPRKRCAAESNFMVLILVRRATLLATELLETFTHHGPGFVALPLKF